MEYGFRTKDLAPRLVSVIGEGRHLCFDDAAPPHCLAQPAAPVCDAGIDWQRNKLLALVRAGTVELRDINEQPDALAHFGASLDDIRRRLHATDEAGRLVVGADVAIAPWRLTPGEGWLAALFGNRVALPVTRFVYDRLADLLFAWNKWSRRW